jgi:hypothetical protein
MRKKEIAGHMRVKLPRVENCEASPHCKGRERRKEIQHINNSYWWCSVIGKERGVYIVYA